MKTEMILLITDDSAFSPARTEFSSQTKLVELARFLGERGCKIRF